MRSAVVETQYAGHARALVEALSTVELEGYDGIVAVRAGSVRCTCGGDGDLLWHTSGHACSPTPCGSRDGAKRPSAVDLGSLRSGCL